ncbi:YIP1 family protein [Candidatus Magnetobacterium casense]|uniref:YIP1 family protein n=1 Tax=Candidatus Magnetobacterium casense TaxID=1455061 RepID=A0ABS6RVY6_9BACT|nr:YIP1 family protein [Candidatus Magnetobacterium casensis]MBV6340782.1 YIP1 family protein [Candidatus Magnetobacterium casensis]
MGRNHISVFSIPSTAIRVLTTPADFFSTMPKKGGYMGPLVFMIAMGVSGGLLKAAISILGFNILEGIGKAVAAILFVPVTVTLFGFLAALALFIIWKILGSRQSYETSYRCVAYMSVLMPVMVVINGFPFPGGLVSVTLLVIFIVIAGEKVHSIPPMRTRIVFTILGLVLAIMYVKNDQTIRQIEKEKTYQQQYKR